MSVIEIGRLLRSGTAGCVIGCQADRLETPAFGAMVRIPIGGPQPLDIYGIIHDIHIDDDGLVRQLVTAGDVPEELILDNRLNRNVPVEMSVLFIGHAAGGGLRHLLPPRPPLTLESIYLCSPAEICAFTAAGRFGYFRHILRAVDLPTAELLAAHLLQAARAQGSAGNPAWVADAERELITLLRDDYPTLMSVLGALADADLPA